MSNKKVLNLKLIALVILALFFVLSQQVLAEDTIKVLMLDSPYDPLPSENAENIDNLTGKVFVNGQFYTGSIEVLKDKNGLYVINNLPFEEYIEGVVASEIGQDWELEALKAQAVISRTYAIYYKNHNAGNNFHITSSILHQLYKGKNTYPLITESVKATAGEILTYNGLPIQAFFHAACKGKTEFPEEVWEGSYPYLQSVDCNAGNTPYDNWQRIFSMKKISDALRIGNLKEIRISSYTSTGRVRTLKMVIEGDKSADSEIEVKAADLRKALGYKELPSTMFSLTIKGEGIIFTGKGFGHGVGLCQWGALEMAKHGSSYREILAHYYPGTKLINSEETAYQKLASKHTP